MNVHVLAMLSTVALPSRVTPLKIRRDSPAASAAVMVPVKVGVMSSVIPSLVTWP